VLYRKPKTPLVIIEAKDKFPAGRAGTCPRRLSTVRRTLVALLAGEEVRTRTRAVRHQEQDSIGAIGDRLDREVDRDRLIVPGRFA
jgi:hypothetical protein